MGYICNSCIRVLLKYVGSTVHCY